MHLQRIQGEQTMDLRVEQKAVMPLLSVFFLLATFTVAVAAPVTPIYEVTGFDNFGPVVAELETHFGGPFPFLEGTIISNVYCADEAFDLVQDGHTAHIEVGYLTFVYNIHTIAYGDIDFFQVNLPPEFSEEPIIAVGWNSAVSDADLLEVNTEEDVYYQIEFGNRISSEPGAFNLDPGETIEVFITFQDVEYAQTTAQVWGGGIPPSNIAVLGAEIPEPASIVMALGALLGFGGVIARKREKR